MDPTTGTFLSVDPVVPQYDDPQSLNAYAYARNNPIALNDPTGMNPVPEDIPEIVVYGYNFDGAPLDVFAANQITSTYGTAIDLVGGMFIAGEAHGVRAKLEGVGAGIGPGVSEQPSHDPSATSPVTDEFVVRGDRGVQVAEEGVVRAATAAGAPIGPSGEDLTREARARLLRGGAGLVFAIIAQELSTRLPAGRARGFARTVSALAQIYGGANLVFSGGRFIAVGVSGGSTGIGTVPGIAAAAFGGGLVVFGATEAAAGFRQLGPAFQELSGG